MYNMAHLSSSASSHLAWIKKVDNHYDFGGLHMSRGVSYHACMLHLYSTQPSINADAQRWFDMDTLEYEKVQQNIRNTILKAKQKLDANEDIIPLFITLGFNHQTWTINSCLKVIETITTLGWVKSCRAVFELYRKNGLHPHCHIYIEPNVKYTKSKVLEKLWAVRGIKRVILQKAFIDYKEAMPYHLEYIMLRKCEAKMPYVEQDTVWREKSNIPIIEINWIHQ